MYSSTLSITLALDGGGWSTPRSGRFTPGIVTRYALYRRLSGPQGRYGRVRKISPPTGIRSPDRPSRSESLYRLRYPGPLFTQSYQNSELDKAGIHKSRVPGHPDDYILKDDVKYLWAVSMELASCN